MQNVVSPFTSYPFRQNPVSRRFLRLLGKRRQNLPVDLGRQLSNSKSCVSMQAVQPKPNLLILVGSDAQGINAFHIHHQAWLEDLKKTYSVEIRYIYKAQSVLGFQADIFTEKMSDPSGVIVVNGPSLLQMCPKGSGCFKLLYLSGRNLCSSEGFDAVVMEDFSGATEKIHRILDCVLLKLDLDTQAPQIKPTCH